MWSSSETVSGLDQRLAASRTYRGGTRKGVLALPGATNNEHVWIDSIDATGGEIRELTDRYGFPVASCATGVMWGNSTHRTNISTLRTNAQASLFASGKVHLLGASAGGLAALNWAKANPTLVQSLTLLIPVIDVQAVYDGNRGGFAASISAAYGGRPPDADNPADNAASFSSIPTRIYYSTDDVITTEVETLAFAAAAGAETRCMGAVGHYWASPWSGRDAGIFMTRSD